MQLSQKLFKQFRPLRNNSAWSKRYTVWVWGSLERHFTWNEMLWKTRNLPPSIQRNFFKLLENESELFQMVQIWLCMSWNISRNVINLMWHNLEKTEFWQNSIELAQKMLFHWWCCYVFSRKYFLRKALLRWSSISHRVRLSPFGILSERLELFEQLLSKIYEIPSKGFRPTLASLAIPKLTFK